MSKLLGNWYDKIGTSRENAPNREAPNRHLKGSKKYKEMIDRGEKSSGDLPFQFTKPPKRTKAREDILHLCDSCHYVSLVSKYRVGQSCKGCSQYTSVNSSNTFLDEETLEAKLEELGLTQGEDL